MIFAIDPGSDKTGTAVLQEKGILVVKRIIATSKLREYMDEVYRRFPFTCVVMGDGTNHKHLQPIVENWIGLQQETITFALVDERYTTVEGRKMYWKYTPRHGWRRLVPLAFQYPPVPVDDFVAWIIGCRYIKKMEEG